METTERTALGEKILKHWRENQPQMVADLEKISRLEEAVLEAQDLAADVLYELVSVQKMNYDAAWELTLRDWLFLPAETSPRRRPPSRPSSGKSNRSWRKRRAPRSNPRGGTSG